MEDIDWGSLRTLNGSQPEAFEELCCQLAAHENTPADSRFVRLGDPDAGVECYWQLPGGDEWGWQAKFFRAPPGSSQWGQIDKSVKTALEKHPRLTRYIVCFPIDRQDPRKEEEDWSMDKWNQHLEKWKDWANEKDMSVEFEYWGRGEILERLSRDEHRGRYYFWFNGELFSQGWFRKRFEEARANVGDRYLPDLNVDLPVAKLFDGLGRTPAFFERLNNQLEEARGTYGRISPSSTPDDVEGSIVEIGEVLAGATEFVKEAGEVVGPIDWEHLRGVIDTAYELVRDSREQLEEAARKKKQSTEEETDSETTSQQSEPYSYQRSLLRQLRRDLSEIETALTGKETILSNKAALLLTGEAGHGKTHLFCDVARKRVEAERPTVLLLGEQFHEEEPWGQMTGLLDLSCTREEFLGALNAAAEAHDSRALILIDALNEGEGKYMWESHLAGLLTAISRYDRLGIALSVRSTYRDLVVPDHLIPDRLIEVEHTGFADHELQATKVFFDHYEIERPSIPLLTPEFQNPLFLRLFCEGLDASGLTRIPDGLQGITQIFSFFIDQINEKLARPEQVGYNPKINNVRKAIERFARAVAQSDDDWIPVTEAVDLINDIKGGDEYEYSLYRQMLSEGVIAEDRFPVGFDEAGEFDYVEGTRFSYERFSDHVIAEHLLDEHLNPEEVSDSFEPGTPLGNLLRDPDWGDAGVIDALAIQVPERTGRELGGLVTEEADSKLYREALVESILWRRTDSFSEETKQLINEHALKYEGTYDRFHNILLMVAADPQHPYNAEFLHRNLARRSLAERDRLWSIFLFDEYDYYPESSAVGRLMDWAWNVDDTAHLDAESVRLAATALTWYLTTSHRPLRDRTTKALVNLLEDRPSVVAALLDAFHDVDDPYVIERLYAVAYGCAMRTHNRGRVEVLADKAYELVFEDGDPPVNILTRDYAREIIERRVHLDSSVPYELEKVRPPYGSEWPDEIPSMGDLEKEYESDGTRFGGGLGRVLGSVTADDFARYVIGADSHSFEWSSRRLDEPDRPSYEERFEDFKEGLSEEQLQGLSELQRAKSFSPVRLVELISEELDGEDFTKEDLDKEIDELRKILRGSLSEEEQDTFDEFVWPYIENPQIDGQKNEFDVSLIQRFVLEKVLDLGYTDDRFEEFDERAVDHRRYGRSGEKPERIGKKYQWIVYYEALARIADNFRFLGDVWSDEEKDYQGPWQLSKIRNIDPSVVNDDPQTSFHLDPNSCWWFDATYDWSLDDELKNWLHDEENVPRAGPRFQVTRESDGTEWLVLHGHFGWYESSAPEEKSRDAIRRQVWYFANSFILPEEEKAESFKWSKGYDFTQHDWMMESLSRPKEVHVGYCYLGELYWSPCYRSQFLFESPNGSNDASEESWRQTTEDFLWERIYDCSGDESVNIDVPAFEIAERMGLKWATMGRFKDSSGKIVAMDPSFEQSGPSMLLIREDEFLTFLEENNLSVIWTINGEKLIAGGGEPVMFDDRMYITGAYTLDKEGSVIGGMSYDIRV